MPLPDRGPSAMKSDGSTGKTTLPENAGILILALCALLAASSSLAAGATIGLALLVAVTFSACVFAAVRAWLPPVLQPAAFGVIFAGAVTALELFLRAWWPTAYQGGGMFLPLALAAGPLLAGAKKLAPARTMRESVSGFIIAALVFACAAALLGGLREFAGQGLGEGKGILLALLPPGAFIALGLLMATWDWLARRFRQP